MNWPVLCAFTALMLVAISWLARDMHARFDRVGASFDPVDDRFDRIEQRIDRRFDRIEQHIEVLAERHIRHLKGDAFR